MVLISAVSERLLFKVSYGSNEHGSVMSIFIKLP